MAKDILFHKLLLDDGVTEIFVRLNAKTTEKASSFYESLLITRQINPQADESHPHSILLLAYMKSQEMFDDTDVEATESAAGYAARLVRETHKQYDISTQSLAYTLALVQGIFVEDKVRDTITVGEVPGSYWDDKEVNTERVKKLLPPLPRRIPFHPVERKAAILNQIAEENPKFQQELTSLAAEVVKKIVAGALIREVDADGFQPESLDGNLDA